MIRQLQRLTRPVPALGDGVLAIAVYAQADQGRLAEQSAAEKGFEGVACVDDAARAAVLYITLWQRYRVAWARDAAQGLLAFVRAMQTADGTFVNFILDWDGRKNLVADTSRPGDGPWVARAMHALACGVSGFGDPDSVDSFALGLPWLDRPTPYLDLRAVDVLAAMEYWRATGAEDMAVRALAWADGIASAAIGDILPDRAGSERIHFWGHLQEVALAEVGLAFGHDDLVAAARRSADTLLAPAAEQGFPGAHLLPFDVSCVVRGLNAVAIATGDSRYERLAGLARAWFDGRNSAAAPVYDRDRGLVLDGIDDGRVSQNSGAESNIEGALALLDSLPFNLFEASGWLATSATGSLPSLEMEILEGATAVCGTDGAFAGAIIVAGGKGERLRPLTNSRPKCLVEVAGRPILEWQLASLERAGVERVAIVGHYLFEAIEAFAAEYTGPLRVELVREERPLGRGGAIKLGYGALGIGGSVLALNGDILCEVDLAALEALRIENGTAAAILAVPLRSPYGIIALEGARVVEFREKPVLEHWINGGIYALGEEAIETFPAEGDHEDLAFPALAAAGRLSALQFSGAWRSIESPKDLREAEDLVASGALHFPGVPSRSTAAPAPSLRAKETTVAARRSSVRVASE